MSERTRWIIVFAVLTALGLIGVAVRTSGDPDLEATGVPSIQEAPPVSCDPETETSLPRIQDTVGVPLDADPEPDPPTEFLPGPVTSNETSD